MPRPSDSVWEHFLVVSERDRKKHVTCNYCNAEYKFAQSSRLKEHLNKCKLCPCEVKQVYISDNHNKPGLPTPLPSPSSSQIACTTGPNREDIKIIQLDDIKDETEHSYAQNREVRSSSSSSSTTEVEDPLPPVKKRKQEANAKQTEPIKFSPETIVWQSSLHRKINSTALYWSEKLERLDKTQRIYAERAINYILFEAELGNLKRDSFMCFSRSNSPQ